MRQQILSKFLINIHAIDLKKKKKKKKNVSRVGRVHLRYENESICNVTGCFHHCDNVGYRNVKYETEAERIDFKI